MLEKNIVPRKNIPRAPIQDLSDLCVAIFGSYLPDVSLLGYTFFFRGQFFHWWDKMRRMESLLELCNPVFLICSCITCSEDFSSGKKFSAKRFLQSSRAISGEARPCAGRVGCQRSQQWATAIINIGEVCFNDTLLQPPRHRSPVTLARHLKKPRHQWWTYLDGRSIEILVKALL